MPDGFVRDTRDSLGIFGSIGSMVADVNRLVDIRKSSNRFEAILPEPHYPPIILPEPHMWFRNHIYPPIDLAPFTSALATTQANGKFHQKVQKLEELMKRFFATKSSKIKKFKNSVFS